MSRVDNLGSDWPALRPLFLELYEHHRPFGLAPLLPDWEKRWHQRFATDSDDRLLVKATARERTIGFADAEIRRSPSIFDEEFGFITDMYVINEWRGRGIGRRMLASLRSGAALVVSAVSISR